MEYIFRDAIRSYQKCIKRSMAGLQSDENVQISPSCGKVKSAKFKAGESRVMRRTYSTSQ